MKKLIVILTVCAVSLLSFAKEKPKKETTFPEYKLGEGARYQMQVDGSPADVKMAFVKRTDKVLVIEIEMNMKSSESVGMPIKMVQQFHLGLVGGKIKILKGFMKIPNIPKAQELPADFLKGYDGAQMNSFLISSESDLDGSKMGKLKMQTTEGEVEAVHYRRTSNGQTIDFWITDDPKLKPLSLVKMKSSGKKKDHNYDLKLKGMVKGYKAQINPADSEPLSAMGRMFLPVLTNSSNFLH